MKKIQILFIFLFGALSACCDKDALPTECEMKCAITQDQGNGSINETWNSFKPYRTNRKIRPVGAPNHRTDHEKA